MTFGFSNVPGPKLPFAVAGRVNKGVGFIMPVGRSVVGSFSIISHVDVVKVIISMDKSCMDSTDFISDLFLLNLDAMLGKDWRDFSKGRK